MNVAITGTGIVSCIGIGTDCLFEAAWTSQSGVVDGLGPISESTKNTLAKRFPEIFALGVPTLYAYSAAKMAMENAGWGGLTASDGLILATTTGQISDWEPGLISFLKGELSAEAFSGPFSHQALGLGLSELAQLLHFEGRSQLLSSACSAGTQAIALGAMWVHSGKVKRCLVGGVEILGELTKAGFGSLQLLSKHPSRPFDENREGINLSEASAFLCLEQNSEKALAQVSGYGFSTDAYHLASPEPAGLGCVRAMKRALEVAQLNPEAIGWVHAHGTGSIANDQAECAAVNHLFLGNLPWISSTKNIHGHALGASGALETILCIEALQRQVVLKTAGLTHPDPKIKAKHPPTHLQLKYEHILKNTLGFGGNNAALVLSRPRQGVRS